MKKMMIGIISLILIAGIGFGVYILIGQQKKEVTIEDVLPQNNMIFIHANNLDQDWKSLTKSPFWVKLNQVNLDATSKVGQTPLSAIIKGIKKEMETPAAEVVMEQFFGQEIALAAYPLDIDMNQLLALTPETLQLLMREVSSKFMLVTRIKGGAQFADFIMHFFNPSKQGLPTETIPYKDFTIRVVTIPELKVNIGYVVIKDLLVIGLGQEAVQKTIDTYLAKKETLRQDEMFQKAKARFGSSRDLMVYANAARILSMVQKNANGLIGILQKNEDLNEGIQENIESYQGEMSQIENFLNAFEAIVLTADWAQISEFNNGVIYEKSKLTPELLDLYACPDSENPTIKFIPKGAIGYQWNNCLKWRDLWAKAEQALESDGMRGEATQEKIAILEDSMGMSLDYDILPALGEEMGGVLYDFKFIPVPFAGEVPIPQLMIFVAVKDQAVIADLLKTTHQIPFFSHQENDYNGVTVHSFVPPTGDRMEIGYCFLDGYLLIAIDHNILKNAIDAKRDQNLAIISDPEFKRIDKGISGPNKSVSYLNVGELSRRIQKVVDWVGGMVNADFKKQEAFQSGSKKKLADVQEVLVQKRGEYAVLEKDMKMVKINFDNQNSYGMNMVKITQEMEDLQGQMDLKKMEIDEYEQEQSDLKGVLRGFQKTLRESGKRKKMVDEFVVPLLDALSGLNATSSRTTMEEDVLRMQIFVDLK